jgi:hypothetical protein
MMTRHITATALCLSLTLALPAGIQAQPDLRSQPIKAVAVQSTLEGEVMVVNTDTRLMTIRLPDGSFEVLHIPPVRSDHRHRSVRWHGPGARR